MTQPGPVTGDVPASYGDVTGEYLALRRGCGLVGGEHELFWVRGPDSVSFLDGLLSQDVAAMAPGAVARSLLLSPQGKLRAVLWLLRDHQAVGIVADAGYGGPAAEDLARFKIRVDVEIDRVSTPLLEVWGPTAAVVLAAGGYGASVGWVRDGATVVASTPAGGLSRFVLAGGDESALVAAGATRVGSLAATALRIEAGEPKMGVDVDHRTIPQESGLIDSAVALDKGCFLGQELVARIDSRGRVNRHLRGIVISENVLPPPGSEVTVRDKTVGAVTSLGESLELRAPVGLAMIRREVEPGSAVEIRWKGGTARARVQELPLDDFTGA